MTTPQSGETEIPICSQADLEPTAQSSDPSTPEELHIEIETKNKEDYLEASKLEALWQLEETQLVAEIKKNERLLAERAETELLPGAGEDEEETRTRAKLCRLIDELTERLRKLRDRRNLDEVPKTTLPAPQKVPGGEYFALTGASVQLGAKRRVDFKNDVRTEPRKKKAKVTKVLDDFKFYDFCFRLMNHCPYPDDPEHGPSREFVTDMHAEITQIHIEESNLEAAAEDDESADISMKISSIVWHKLFHHQKVGVRFLVVLYSHRMGCLVADEMGLGKTVQIIAFLNCLLYSGELTPTPALAEAVAPATYAATNAGPSALLSNEQEKALEHLLNDWETQRIFKLKPVLILVPTTILEQWENEFRVYSPTLKIIRLYGWHIGRFKTSRAAREIAESGGIFLSSYETVRTQLKFFVQFHWFYCILDEGQRIRNPDAQTTLAVKRLKVQHRILLTGSPIQNDLREFWSVVDFVSPGKFGTLPVFMDNFAEPIMKAGVGHPSLQASRRAHQCLLLLKSYLSPHLLRRTKNGLMRDQHAFVLPAKEEQIVLCPLTIAQYQIYVDFLVTHNVEKEVSRQGRRIENSRKRKRKFGEGIDIQAKALFFISVLTKICNHPDMLLLNSDLPMPQDYGSQMRSGKLIVLTRILRTWIKSENRKILIFSRFLRTLEIIEKLVKPKYGYLTLTGDIPISERLRIAEKFNADPKVSVLLLTTKVGSLGLNLTGASGVVIFDPDWNPTVDEQAQERAWRIGQDANVTVYRFLSKGTIEEKIYKRQIYKQILSSKILSDRNSNKIIKANDFRDLFAFPPLPPGISELDLLNDEINLPPRLKAIFTKAVCRQHSAQGRHIKGNISEVPSSHQPKDSHVPLNGGDDSEDTEQESEQEGDIQGTTSCPSSQAEEISIKSDTDFTSFKSEETESPNTDTSPLTEEKHSGAITDDEESGDDRDALLKFLFSSKHVAGVWDHKASLMQSKNTTILANADDQTRSLVKAIESSRRNRLAFSMDIPTWTGKHGLAGKPVGDATQGTDKEAGKSIWSFDELEVRFKGLPEIWDFEQWTKSKRSVGELRLIECVFGFFFQKRQEEWQATTGDILLSFAPLVKTEKQKNLLKKVLTRTCNTIKRTDNSPTLWQLKPRAQSVFLSQDQVTTPLAKFFTESDSGGRKVRDDCASPHEDDTWIL
eukprot:Gregarina_sp_Poly_1__8830@NODE_530_length_7661_cov_56_450619_g420_i0_p1_GENE_NODE_530_length_7661_cov_56_450619_g420_i0NODE_530_length_7661_cov_56_450619_g420_i0_p1_ORF_typecomplete_len1175_score215_24SNF2_N/PF00176_23/4_6e63Helicase_C/PF00271_31/2_1e03Helicase_C/PF00271_31/2_7e17ERCC3_RAD25_C/PF16203_5/1_2e09ResIII/PF04851_15/9e08HDA23/PF11496_8/7_9e05_NODE_530_length_7661_cov_56_450619_g420_i022995823